MKLYLDDERTPEMSGYDPEAWVIVREPEAFREMVREHAQEIEVISFDHDLGVDDSGALLATGYDLLKEWIREHAPDPAEVEVRVHSANPVGAQNIRAYWKSWCKHRPTRPTKIAT